MPQLHSYYLKFVYVPRFSHNHHLSFLTQLVGVGDMNPMPIVCLFKALQLSNIHPYIIVIVFNRVYLVLFFFFSS